MSVQLPLPLKQFIRSQSYLYQKLCFWAGKREVDDPTGEVNQYLTQLVLQADAEGDNVALLQH